MQGQFFFPGMRRPHVLLGTSWNFCTSWTYFILFYLPYFYFSNHYKHTNQLRFLTPKTSIHLVKVSLTNFLSVHFSLEPPQSDFTYFPSHTHIHSVSNQTYTLLICMGYKKFLVVCCREIITLVTDLFFFLSPFTRYRLFVCWSCKEIKGEKEKDRDTFERFYFRGLRLFCGEKCFLEFVEIIVLFVQGVRGISGIIFGKLWIVSVEYKSFVGHFGLLWIGWSAVCVCGHSVCLTDAATRRYKALLDRGP